MKHVVCVCLCFIVCHYAKFVWLNQGVGGKFFPDTDEGPGRQNKKPTKFSKRLSFQFWRQNSSIW